ncbi:hypothetical protein [Clostridioides difficile]|nr:hypothetical protein [Clostridioides difficile]
MIVRDQQNHCLRVSSSAASDGYKRQSLNSLKIYSDILKKVLSR